ncbi:hypothetical protein Dsin_024807 [Dipteronia sinensis]|uniref:CRIB domain-containing protein n=1 Tax=Dipteronia sinensis TaxID=43782 RepID=A0AAD9ZV51_9ROSI|nr:hypothetical protein Dsin_024807 [Dipteronia sinensis]
MSNHKMKGLLKGLRYISQMFENEKEADMQIGFPTDVKHVAHIGWDGPSVNSPSWMNEFKAAPGFQSQPLGDPGEIKDESEIQWVSEDSTRRRNQNGPGEEVQEVPKSSRRHASTGSSTENPNGEKTEKTKSRRSSKSHKEGSEYTKSRQPKESSQVGEPSTKLPDLPKKSRRKKSKDSGDGGSSRSSRSRRANASKSSDTVPEESGSVSKGNEQELAQAPGLNSSEGVEEKGFIEIY